MFVRQPKRKSVRGRRLWTSGSLTIQVVDSVSGESALSLEGVTDTGVAPAAEVMASETDSEVTGASTC